MLAENPVTLSLRCCERRLLAQRCGLANQLLGLTKRPLSLGHVVPVQADCPDEKKGIAKPVGVAELPIQRFGAPRGLPVFFAAGALIEPCQGQTEVRFDNGRQIRRGRP